MGDYVPRSDADKVHWVGDFAAWMNQYGTNFGFSQQEVQTFYTLAGLANSTYDAHLVAQLQARSARSAKDAGIGDAIAMARDFAQRLQHAPGMTDAQREAAGIPVADPTKTPQSPDDILAILAPLLLLDFSVRRQVTIHWGPNPGNEHENGKPEGVFACQIQYAVDTLPEDDTGWMLVGQDTESPIVHKTNFTAARKVFYRACYLDRKLRPGPFGDVSECTVSV